MHQRRAWTYLEQVDILDGDASLSKRLWNSVDWANTLLSYVRTDG